MTEKSKLSISFRVDDGVVEHNNRFFIPKNVDPARTCDNITYKSENLREVYHRLFDEALEEYNSKKRSNEKIADYYEHIENGKQEKPFYEVVVQFGDMESCGLTSGNWETAKEMLDEYMKSFEERNPNMKVFNSVLHLDEATPHLHIDFVPICTNQTRGLSTRVSLKRALAEQGITANSHKKTEWSVWKDTEFEYMTEILRRHGFERDIKNVHREHLTVDEYKDLAEKKAAILAINKQVNELKKKNPTELTAEEFELLNNQNDYLRQRITELQQDVQKLTKQLGAQFIPVTVLNPDKLQYTADGLARAKIPHVAESNTLYVPDYAVKTLREILSHYAPLQNAVTIREQIALDIDCLIYSSANLDDLLTRLKENGYEIKQGKYIAVKHPSAERFVRLKTLGDDYCQGRLEQRILSRDDFANFTRAKIQTATYTERIFYTEILSVTAAVKELRIEPKKIDKAQIYTFHNDANIDYLVKQLNTIAEFRLTDRESIVKKGCEVMDNINEIRTEGCDPSPERVKLTRINELLKAYDVLVEGNYIDNLIKAQKQQQTVQQPKSTPKKHNRK